MLRVTTLVLLFYATVGWTISKPSMVTSHHQISSQQHIAMLAKAKKNRNSRRKDAVEDSEAESISASDNEQSTRLQSSMKSDAEAPVEERVASVLRNAGIMDTDVAASAKPGQPPDPLSRIPKQGQELLERFFTSGAVLFGSIFLISGISVSVEAFCKVLGSPLPVAIDEVLVQYVEPALTPSVLILFAFSISLGILKQLQLGSASAGVLYTEEDD